MSAKLPKVSQFVSFREKAYRVIKEAILTQQFKADELLVEKELAHQLGVSRTPVREALHRLEEEGLVCTVPQKGTFVMGVTLQDLQEVFQIREALESAAARLAAPNIDPAELARVEKMFEGMEAAIKKNDYQRMFQADLELHNLILNTAGNRRITQIIEKLNAQIHWVRVNALNLPGRNMETLVEHRRIIAALKTGEPDLVEKALREHLIKVNMSAPEVFAKAKEADSQA